MQYSAIPASIFFKGLKRALESEKGVLEVVFKLYFWVAFVTMIGLSVIAQFSYTELGLVMAIMLSGYVILDVFVYREMDHSW